MGQTERDAAGTTREDIPEEPSLRASDAERAAVADLLRAHWAVGRLEADEFEHRLTGALTARTVDELARLHADLPAVPARRSGELPRTVNRAGLPGRRAFRQCHLLDIDRAQCFRQAVAHILPVMVAGGFDIRNRFETELLVFDRGVERVFLSFADRPDGGTQLVVQGTARRRVRKVFAQITG